MLWACVLLPQLALDAVLRRQPDPHVPLALVTGPAHLRSVQAVNAAASAAGLKAGMRLSAAYALQSNFTVLEYCAEAEAHWQRFLAAWAYRYSSQVSTQWPGCLLLEVRASFSLLGPWSRIEAQLREDLVQLGFSHRIALAPTPRAAWVLAGLDDGLAVMQAMPMIALLDRVRVQHARLPEDCGLRLQRMGIDDLGALRRLPRPALRRRFGIGLLEHLDCLYGNADDPLTYYAPPDCFDMRLELGHEVESHTALLFPLRRLINDLCTYLSVRDGGVQRFLLRLEHEGAHHDIEVGLLAAERDPALLFELARSRLEQVRLKQPVVGVRLLARELPPFVPATRDLFDSGARQELPWPQLRERLRARLGDDALHQVALGSDPRPELTWRRAQEDDKSIRAPVTQLPPRPTWLLSRPIPLRDRHVRIVSGPERLESGWWDGADARRDYYVLETSRGQRAWAFAPPGERDNWMLHGWFA